MRSSCIVFVIVTSALIVTACGSSKEEQAAKQATEAAAAVAKQGGQAGAGSAEVAKAFEQLTGQGGPAPVEPVSFRELQVVLPELAGWEKGQPTGEKMSVPIAISQSEVVYTKDEGRLTAKVVDTGFRQMFFLPYTMMMAVGYEKESSDGYEKATMVGTHPAFEKWDQSSKRGELAVAVGKRFFVSVEGENIQNTAVLRELMSHIDLNKLAGMK
jgi:hypothetical protein